MKPWLKRTLVGVFGASVLFGGLAACSHRHPGHGHGWQAMSEEDAAQFKSRMVDRIGGKLELDEAQKAKLGVLADEVVAARKALRAGSTDPRADLQGLVAGAKFDRTKAQQMLDQKLQTAQGSSPKLLAAFGDFYDSLSPEQQQKVRDRMDRRGHGWWGRG